MRVDVHRVRSEVVITRHTGAPPAGRLLNSAQDIIIRHVHLAFRDAATAVVIEATIVRNGLEGSHCSTAPYRPLAYPTADFLAPPPAFIAAT